MNLYRLAAAAGLLTLFLAGGRPGPVGEVLPELFQWTALAWLGLACAFTLLLWLRRPSPFVQTCLYLAVDTTAVCLLMHASGGVVSGLGLLLLAPVAVAALLAATRVALLFAAVAAIAVLLEQFLSVMAGVTTAANFTAAGLLGGMLFLVAVAVYPYAQRLAESEALAEQRGVDLRNLSELSAYIVRQLRESLLVVDGQGIVRLANESAARHLLGVPGLSPGRPLAIVHPALARIVERWRSEETHPHECTPMFSADGGSQIVPSIAPLDGSREGPLLVFLEDTALLSERAQQLKLASLGRLSASIAHEIRNPVGAVSHAAQLLAESPRLEPDERRLADIMVSNASRVSGIIDNILSLSQRRRSQPRAVDLRAWLQEFADEYCQSHGLPASALAVTHADREIRVRMDPLHLRQILDNLCDNARKYAVCGDNTRVELYAGRLLSTDRPYLEVADRGPGIGEEIRDRMFEPFVTGKGGGTGLGLYITRELCESNGAVLRYRPRRGGGSLFVIVFTDAKRWEARTSVRDTVSA